MDTKIGVQFSVELVVSGDGLHHPEQLNHTEMQRQLTFALARAMVNFGYRGFDTRVGLVKYQTSYPISE